MASETHEDRFSRGLEMLRRIGGENFDGPINALAETSADLSRFTVEYPYGDVLSRKPVTHLEIEASDLFSPDDAIRRLESMLGKMPRWSTLSSFLPPGISGLLARSALAAHLVGALELCKQGRIELRQDPGQFAAIWVKAREGDPVEQ